MDFSGETDNKDCTMNTLSMLVSLIETAIKEKTIDKKYDDFLEDALAMGMSSYTLNVLIVNTKKRIENDDTYCNVDIAGPFVYRPDIIKPEPEIRYVYKTQENTVVGNKKGLGFIIALVIILLLNVRALALFAWFCQDTMKKSANSYSAIKYKTDSIESKIDSVKAIAGIGDTPIFSFDSWTSTNKGQHSSESHKDYSFTVDAGDKLSFSYDVSTEYEWDELNVYLYTCSDTTKLLTKSGVERGTKIHTFDKGGDIIVRFEYRKDGLYHKNKDAVTVSNIKIYKPYDAQIEEIKKILNVD